MKKHSNFQLAKCTKGLTTHYDTCTFKKREVKMNAKSSDTRGQVNERP